MAVGTPTGGLRRGTGNAVQLHHVKVYQDGALGSGFAPLRNSIVQQDWAAGQLCPAVAVAAGTGELAVPVMALVAAVKQPGERNTEQQRHTDAVKAARAAAAALLPELYGLRAHMPEQAAGQTLLVHLPQQP